MDHGAPAEGPRWNEGRNFGDVEGRRWNDGRSFGGVEEDHGMVIGRDDRGGVETGRMDHLEDSLCCKVDRYVGGWGRREEMPWLVGCEQTWKSGLTVGLLRGTREHMIH